MASSLWTFASTTTGEPLTLVSHHATLVYSPAVKADSLQTYNNEMLITNVSLSCGSSYIDIR